MRRIAARPERFDRCPVLLAHPENDAWTPLGVSKPFFDRLGGEKTLVLLDVAGHFPPEPVAIARLEDAMRALFSKVTSQSPQAAVQLV